MRRSVFAVAVLAGLPVAAHAQTMSWAAGVSGNWNDAANWSPMNVPNAGSENATISVAGTYTVTFDTSTTIGSLMLTNPNATLEIPGSRLLGVTSDSVNNGLIIVNPTNSAANAAFQAFSPVNITGSGVMEFAGGPDDAQLNTFNSGTVISQGAGHTMRGAFTMNATFENNGLVRAQVMDTESQVVLQGGSKTNNALMQAGTDATLSVSSITVDQTLGGALEADGGTVSLIGTNTIVGGTLRKSANGGLLQRDVGTSTFTGVTLLDDFEIRQGGIINISGGMTNNGSLFVNPENGAANAAIQYVNAGLLDGTGEVVMGGGAGDSAISTFNAGTVITQTATHTIRGAGDINATMVNNGLVRAEAIGDESQITLQSGSKTNNALMQAGPGATLQVGTITLDQSGGGTIEADGGTLQFAGTNSVVGGTIDMTGSGGLIERVAGTSAFQGVTIDGDFEIRQGGIINVTGGLTNNGSLSINPENGAANASLQFLSISTLGGTGEVVMGGGAGDSAISTFNAGTVLTQASTHTIRGAGDINATMVNNGLVRAEVTGDESQITLQTGSKTNNALMQAGPGATLDIGSIALDQSAGGTIEADGGTVRFSGTNTVVGGTIDMTASGGHVERVAGTTAMQGVTLETDFEIRQGGIINVTNGLVNNGTLDINPENGAANALLQFLNAGTLGGTGTIRMAGGTGDSRIGTANAGTVMTIGPDQTVTGDGDLSGVLAIQGTIEPGLDGPGQMQSASATVTCGPTTTHRFEIGGLTAGTEYDRLAISSGSYAIDGDLIIEIVDGFVPQVGDEFTIMTSNVNNISGGFDTVTVINDNEQRVRVTVEPNQVVVGYTCLTDINGDFILNNADINAFVNGFLAQQPLGDINNDGNWNNTDINLFVQLFLGGCV